MRGRLALAGIRPSGTPIAEYVDAQWAALADLLGSGEHLLAMWTDLTGEVIDTTPTAGAPVDPGQSPAIPTSGEHGTDRDAVAAVQNLPDDDLRRWIPAYRRALDDAETAQDGNEPALTQLDRHWRHTSSFAAGQASLLASFGDASRTARTTPDGHTVAVKTAAKPTFGMPTDWLEV